MNDCGVYVKKKPHYFQESRETSAGLVTIPQSEYQSMQRKLALSQQVGTQLAEADRLNEHLKGTIAQLREGKVTVIIFLHLLCVALYCTNFVIQNSNKINVFFLYEKKESKPCLNTE